MSLLGGSQSFFCGDAKFERVTCHWIYRLELREMVGSGDRTFGVISIWIILNVMELHEVS